jgi:hypothetical protein
MSGLSLYALALMLNYLSETVLLGFAIALPNLRAGIDKNSEPKSHQNKSVKHIFFLQIVLDLHAGYLSIQHKFLFFL